MRFCLRCAQYSSRLEKVECNQEQLVLSSDANTIAWNKIDMNLRCSSQQACTYSSGAKDAVLVNFSTVLVLTQCLPCSSIRRTRLSRFLSRITEICLVAPWMVSPCGYCCLSLYRRASTVYVAFFLPALLSSFLLQTPLERNQTTTMNTQVAGHFRGRRRPKLLHRRRQPLENVSVGCSGSVHLSALPLARCRAVRRETAQRRIERTTRRRTRRR